MGNTTSSYINTTNISFSVLSEFIASKGGEGTGSWRLAELDQTCPKSIECRRAVRTAAHVGADHPHPRHHILQLTYGKNNKSQPGATMLSNTPRGGTECRPRAGVTRQFAHPRHSQQHCLGHCHAKAWQPRTDKRSAMRYAQQIIGRRAPVMTSAIGRRFHSFSVLDAP